MTSPWGDPWVQKYVICSMTQNGPLTSQLAHHPGLSWAMVLIQQADPAVVMLT